MLNKSRNLLKEQTAPPPAPTPAPTPAAGTPTTGAKPTVTGVKPNAPDAEQPKTIGFSGKVGDENKEVNFYVTYMRKDNKLEITKTQLDIDGKRVDNPDSNTISVFTKNYDLFPSNKTKPEYESVYTIVQRAMKNSDISKSTDTKKLMANANAASLVLPHKYNESYGVKPQTIQDVNIQFYPYKVVDQSTGSKTACKVPTYYSISSNGKQSDLKQIDDRNSLKSVGEEFENTRFGTYAMGDKSEDLFKQIKQMGQATCAA